MTHIVCEPRGILWWRLQWRDQKLDVCSGFRNTSSTETRNATTGTQTEIVGCKGKEIWSPEPQFIGKETFFFVVFSLRNSGLFFFSFLLFKIGFAKALAWHRPKHISLTHTYFSRLPPVSLSVFTLIPDRSLDSLQTQTYFLSSLPFTLLFGWREATTGNESAFAGYSFDRSRVLNLGKKIRAALQSCLL